MNMCFFRKRRERKRLEREKAANQTLKEDVVIQHEAPKVVEEQPKPEKVVVKDEVKTQEKVNSPDDSKPKTSKPQKYHVSQNKDEDSDSYKKWRVRKEGSTKTIKFFDTQKEAISYAEELAEKAGSSVVIHKVDGSIRKQDYSKKE